MPRPVRFAAVTHSLLIGATLSLAASVFAQSTPSPEKMLAELKSTVQAQADHQAYPITGINPNDVREVLSTLKSIDRDEWAAAWSAMGDKHVAGARSASKSAERREHLRQAWLDYMFGAWPAQTTAGKRAAYVKSIDAFVQYGKLLPFPVQVVRVPFEGKDLIGYLQLPKGKARSPVVVSIGGLDEYKEFAVESGSEIFLKAGLGVFSMDMPGTGQSPVKMEVGAERVVSKAIDFLASNPKIDPKRIAVSGASAGGYWAALAGYVDRDRVRAAVVRGGPIHEYFQPGWQRKSLGTSEYLFGLKEARMTVYGFKEGEDQAFLDAMQAFSLKTRGILDKPSSPMLVINGEKDTQVPVEDLYILLRTGTPKFGWVNPIGGHTGRSKDWSLEQITQKVIVPWLNAMMPASR